MIKPLLLRKTKKPRNWESRSYPRRIFWDWQEKDRDFAMKSKDLQDGLRNRINKI